MRRMSWLTPFVLLAALGHSGHFAAADTGVTLHSAVEAVAGGEPFEVALRFELPDGGFLFWENPGADGQSPRVEWSLPEGFAVSSLRFPVPNQKDVGGSLANIIEGTPILLASVTPPAELQSGKEVKLAADVSWEPGASEVTRNDHVELALVAADQAKASEDEDTTLLFRIAQRKQPAAPGKGKFAAITPKSSVTRIAKEDRFELTLDVKLKAGYHAQSNAPLSEFFVPTAILFKRTQGLSFGDAVWPDAHIRTDPNLGRISEFAGDFKVTVPVTVIGPTASEEVIVAGLFKYQACEDSGRCFPPEAIEWSVNLTSTTVGAAVAADEATAARDDSAKGGIGSSSGTDSKSWLERAGLFGAIIGGLLGGLILNIMPCVLPVISIKILSFVQQANEQPRRVFHLGLTFAAGIIVSFWVLAAGILMLQHFTEQTRGWGAFFQEPAFVVSMIVVMFVFALNLFGVFEIILPGAAAGKLAGATEREGFSGAFMKGVLATLLATPCTAPFLASAVSFALASSGAVVFVIFTSAGAGMALPYVLLTARPAWMKYMPKPGTWMESFKQFMGFLLIGTAVWLLWVLGKLLGESGVVWTVAFLAFLGLAAWMYGRVDFRSSALKRVAVRLAALGVLLVGAGFCRNQYEPRAATVRAAEYSPTAGLDWRSGAIPWVSYSQGLAEKLSAEGKTVYVDYTASWCLTCQANKKLVLGADQVKKKLEELGVVPVSADFTSYDPTIADDLKRFNRDAVPLNVIYPAGRPDQPIVLPVVLTPGTVLGALNEAGPSTAASTTAAAPHS